MSSKKWWSVIGAGLLVVSLAACGDDDDAAAGGDRGGGEELSGTITIDGSSTVAPLSEAAAELFMEEHPGVQITVATSGTGGGFERFCNGETDISDASRAIEEDEVAACESGGVEWEEITVANDALSVLVHPDNPINCLTIEQLNAIWGPDSTIANWREIPGLEGQFDEQLVLYGPGTDSGTFGYFTEAVNGEEGAQRTDYENIGENDNQGIQGVQGTPGGMFYVGFSFYLENQDSVKALQIDGGDGCVPPAADTVLDGSYTPLGRQLYIYPSAEALQRPEVQAFVRFYVENAATIAEERGFIGLTAEQTADAQQKIDSLLG
ncbi:MAG TPA: PstS family phosphate ABC transporter substrate-binding protein [Natronosporangium sp.]